METVQDLSPFALPLCHYSL